MLPPLFEVFSRESLPAGFGNPGAYWLGYGVLPAPLHAPALEASGLVSGGAGHPLQAPLLKTGVC